MDNKKIILDTTKMLGFRLIPNSTTKHQIGSKVGGKASGKQKTSTIISSKIGGKIGSKTA